jgi:hypothetical protein
LIVRGDGFRVNIGEYDAAELNAHGYKWSGHTHVGDYLAASEGDKKVLRQFAQKRSVIYNAMGKRRTFTSYNR